MKLWTRRSPTRFARLLLVQKYGNICRVKIIFKQIILAIVTNAKSIFI